MKTLVAYYTLTGNTRKVAEAIFYALAGEKTLLPLEDAGTPEGYDLIFIGFPVMQFGPPRIVRNFLSKKVAGKRIALFITHAMVSGSDDPQQVVMLSKELDRCRAACSGSELAGLFHCQGELSEKIAEELMESRIPMLMDFASLRPLTLGHPDEAELAAAAEFAKNLTGRQEPARAGEP